MSPDSHETSSEGSKSKTNQRKRLGSDAKKKEATGNSNGHQKRPKRASACANYKEKPIRISGKSSVVEKKKEHVVDDELEAIVLTTGKEEDRPNRRLTDFTFHDTDGNPKLVEMLEFDDLFISGLILPLEETTDKEKDKGVRCEGFGRIESWAISGYEEGFPVIWVSTDIADYECLKPAGSYKNLYEYFSEKARACVEIYKKISKGSGGTPDLSLDELLAGSVRSMSGSKSFSSTAAIRNFVLSQGEFVYDQLIGLDETSMKNEQKFAGLPVLEALRDESRATRNNVEIAKSATLGPKIKDVGSSAVDDVTNTMGDEGDDVRLAHLLQEEENWQKMKWKKNQAPTTSNKFYIQIIEDEIANDYPLPAYYKPTSEETDEFIVFDNDMDVYNTDELPRSMLHNWSLYNTDSRLVSLELLPMKPCSDIDVTVFGSGVMTADDGTGFCLDDDNNGSSSGSAGTNVDGIPIFLSAIKEWMIEFGSSMVFISIRTDMAWYRLGKPSKQYAAWYAPVLKTAKLAISIITMLKEENRVSRLSFADVIRRVSNYEPKHLAYISSKPSEVERYIVVHGQVILQQFHEFPDATIRRSAFVSGLLDKMETRRHTKWLVKKKKILQKTEVNLNPRASMAPIISKRKTMQATTTRLINRIWGDYYSNYSPEDTKQEETCEAKEDEEADELEEVEDDDAELEEQSVPLKTEQSFLTPRLTKLGSANQIIEWGSEIVGKKSSGEPLYNRVIVNGHAVDVGTAVMVEDGESVEHPVIYFVEYMFEALKETKMLHGRMMRHGSQTVLGNASNDREVFLTNSCIDIEVKNIKQAVVVELCARPWGHQHRKDNIIADRADRMKAEERKKNGLPVEYYCKSLYCPEKGAFVSLPSDTMCLGSGVCYSCNVIKLQKEKEGFRLLSSETGFVYKGVEYSAHDFVYICCDKFHVEKVESGTFKAGRNVGLKAYVVCQILEIVTPKSKASADPTCTSIKVRRFFRPEDISAEKAYSSDIREVFYSEEKLSVSVNDIEGRCEVRKKTDLPSLSVPAVFEHVFFCELLYDPSNGSLKKLPSSISLKYSSGRTTDKVEAKKRKGKSIEGENGEEAEPQKCKLMNHQLATLDIFAGCGGLSEGLERAGASITKWAIEYEEPAGDAFKLNHPESLMFVNNCNVILRAVMEKCGDLGECIATAEAAELAAKLGEKDVSNLPLPGEVDFINGGPPCQGFSGMNRFNQSTWSKVQCEMILAFLSFADYYRPRFFLLENVRNFVSFNKGQTFRLTLASLLEMGYQVRFGILEAGSFGVSQSRKRAFIWAASPEETLPEWPEPMHVFGVPELKISLSGNEQYAAVKSTASGAPFRAITVRDTIGDLPAVENGASRTTMEYENNPISWFQRKIRGDADVLTDHISKEMNELNLIRCQRIPKRPGADWRDLPEEKVKLSNGQTVDLIPWCLPNTAKRHNQWKGLFGRLDWEGNFPTSVTDPQPMGKVGMCFHPDQDRILTVRECARSQGFPDSYKFSGNIQHKHRQIGNAVPPPLAYALGRKLKEAVEWKNSK
ncbi:unnamed protein product [Rhodiola kirilowii]